MKYRILISAYAVSPIRGSECAVGWQICKRLGQYHDIVVLHVEKTPSGNPYAQEINEWERENKKIPGVTFVSVPMPKYTRFFTLLHDYGFWPAYYWGYKAWQKEAFQKATQLHLDKPFTLTHQLTMIGFREPGYLWQLDIPFVWGPIGGLVQIPKSFIKERGYFFRFTQYAKNFINDYQRKHSLRPIKAAQKATKIWVVEREGKKIMEEIWGVSPGLMIETGSTINESQQTTVNKSDKSLQLVWSGLINFRKYLPILIKAISLIKDLPITLTIVGDGPEKLRCKQLAKELKINNRIVWKGWLSFEEAVACVEKSDLFVLTSIKEGTPHVIIEALSFGVPVLCHDTCGMSTVITEHCGIKIPLIDPNTSVVEFSKAISTLHHNRSLLKKLSAGSLNRASELTWDIKAKEFAQAYSNIACENNR